MRTVLFLLVCIAISHAHPFHPLDALEGYHQEHVGHSHSHSFHYLDEKTGGKVKLAYNVTKHADDRFTQIRGAKTLDCKGTQEVTIAFVGPSHAAQFLADAAIDNVLMSHHDVRCEPDGRSVLMRIVSITKVDESTVHVQGIELAPFKVIQDASIHFETNIVPTARHTYVHPPHRSQRMKPLWGIKLPNPVKVVSNVGKAVMNTAKAAVNTVTSVVSGSFTFSKDETPSVWPVPITGNLFDKVEKLKMLCSDCSFRFQPIVRFAIDINNFKLRTMSIMVEGIASFDLSPSIDVQALEKEFSQTLADISFAPILFTIGGVPVELVPQFNTELKLVVAVQVRAKLGMRLGIVGTLKAGVRYDQQNGIRSSFEANYARSPRGYSFLLAKACGTVTGKASTVSSIGDCDDLCSKDSSCVAFKWSPGINTCQPTTQCTEQSYLASEDWYFRKVNVPEPTPLEAAVEVTVQVFLIPTAMLLINRIGGPLVSAALSVTSTSEMDLVSRCATTTIVSQIEVVVGAKISIEIGPAKIYEKDLVMQSVYSKEIPIGEWEKCLGPASPPSTGSAPAPAPPSPGVIVSPAPAVTSPAQTLPAWCTAPPQTTASVSTPRPSNVTTTTGPTNTQTMAPTVVQTAAQTSTPAPAPTGTRAPVCSPVFPTLPIPVRLGQTWIGTCDAETFRYTVLLRYVGGRDNLAVVSMNIFDGEFTCVVQGLYSIRSSTSDEIYLSRTPDEDVESDTCDFQTIPARFTAKVVFGGGGIWLLHRTNWCARTMLRRGSSIEILNVGESLFLEQKMSSSMVVLVAQWDSNVVIYSYASNGPTWASGTHGRRVNRMSFDPDGFIRIKTATDSVVSTLNPNGPRGGQYAVLGDDCTLSIYASLPFVKPLWKLTARCPQGDYIPLAPVVHRGGNMLYAGEVIYQNAGIYNDNGFFEHGVDEGNLYSWRGLTNRIWSTNTRGYCTIVITLQFDGELILQDCNGAVVWKTGTWGKGATVLRLEACGISLYKKAPNIDKVWSSYTSCSLPDVPDVPGLPFVPPLPSPYLINQMERGHFLLPGQSLLSRNGILLHQPDGNVVLYRLDTKSQLWSTRSAGKCTRALSFQFDGNLVLYGCGGPDVFWSSDTWQQRPRFLAFSDNCVLELFKNPQRNTLVKGLSSATCAASSTSPLPPLPPMGPIMSSTTVLYPGQTVFSLNSGLLHQVDGNLIFFTLNPTRIVWQSGTRACTSSLRIVNGNAVLLSCTNTTVWASNTTGSGATMIIVGDTCFSVDRPTTFEHAWASSSSCPVYRVQKFDLPTAPPVAPLPPFPTSCVAPRSRLQQASQTSNACTLPPAAPVPASPSSTGVAPGATASSPVVPISTPRPATPRPATPSPTLAPIETIAPVLLTDPSAPKFVEVDICTKAVTQASNYPPPPDFSTECWNYLNSDEGKPTLDALGKCAKTQCDCMSGTFNANSCNRVVQCNTATCAFTYAQCRANVIRTQFTKAKDCTQDAATFEATAEARTQRCLAQQCQKIIGCKDSEYVAMCASNAIRMFVSLTALALCLLTILF